VADGEVCLVGSANVDFRSFRLNFELGALVADRGFAGGVAARFREDLRASREVSAAEVAAWSVPVRLGHGAARLLAPLL
jgi:cardiolipin synthase